MMCKVTMVAVESCLAKLFWLSFCVKASPQICIFNEAEAFHSKLARIGRNRFWLIIENRKRQRKWNFNFFSSLSFQDRNMDMRSLEHCLNDITNTAGVQSDLKGELRSHSSVFNRFWTRIVRSGTKCIFSSPSIKPLIIIRQLEERTKKDWAKAH